ncbi:MAG: diaminopimelate epimerase [Chloroflexi bacterium]|nr:diaminopimelate epimerase [Chloroflexota bacterium]MBP7043221.1 diaminopimelate epimerase [Chloroflexota bacterium]
MAALFWKYQALGNDMLVIDPAVFPLTLTPARARLLCHRHFGLGADGICYGPLPGEPGPNTMRFLNPDGSEAEKSGNGLRIFARYLWDVGLAHGRSYTITIHGQTIQADVLDDEARTIALAMGQLTFSWVEEEVAVDGAVVRLTAVSIGNPHCVLFTDDLTAVHTIGPKLETSPLFPNRTNVQLVHVVDAHSMEIAIWERGAGYTLASGTSASAAAGTAVRTGRCQSPVTVRMAGGEATVTVDENWQVVLTGGVTAVAQGTIAPDLLRELEDLAG